MSQLFEVKVFENVLLDSNGTVELIMANDFDYVVVGCTSPQTGIGTALVGCSAVKSAVSQVKVRCWASMGAPNFQVQSANNHRVTLTVIAVRDGSPVV